MPKGQNWGCGRPEVAAPRTRLYIDTSWWASKGRVREQAGRKLQLEC